MAIDQQEEGMGLALLFKDALVPGNAQRSRLLDYIATISPRSDETRARTIGMPDVRERSRRFNRTLLPVHEP